MQDAPTFTSAAEQAALRRREVLPKQQHRQVSRLPRQHDCVDSTGCRSHSYGSGGVFPDKRKLSAPLSRHIGILYYSRFWSRAARPVKRPRPYSALAGR